MAIARTHCHDLRADVMDRDCRRARQLTSCRGSRYSGSCPCSKISTPMHRTARHVGLALVAIVVIFVAGWSAVFFAWSTAVYPTSQHLAQTMRYANMWSIVFAAGVVMFFVNLVIWWRGRARRRPR